MGNDTPDWGSQYGSTIFYHLSDLAELASRLGSPVSFDRRGAVIWFETFDNGLDGLEVSPGGVSGAINLVTTPIDVPPFAARLISGPANGSETSVARTFNHLTSQRVGIAASFQPSASNARIRLRLFYTDGSNGWDARVTIDVTTNLLVTVTNGTGQATLISETGIVRVDDIYTFVKLVVDTSTKKLVRVLFGDEEFDCSAYDMQDTGAVSNKSIFFDFALTVINAGGTQNCYLDNIIFTGAEPTNAG